MNFKEIYVGFFLVIGCFLLGVRIIPAQNILIEETGKPIIVKDEKGKPLEPSAVLALSEDRFLMADDKTPNLYVFSAAEKKVVQTININGFKIEKPKWEALAFDGKFCYLIGSHAVDLNDDAEKLANRSHLLRFELSEKADPAKSLEITSYLNLNITESLKKSGLYNPDPKNNKVKIEGLTVRELKDKKKALVFALREPFDKMTVFSAELPDSPKDGELLELKPLFTFEAGKIGLNEFKLSSIEYSAGLGGFLVLTSTEDKNNKFHGNGLWLVSDEKIKNDGQNISLIPQILHLWAVEMKAEGICFLPKDTPEKMRLAIVFDNDHKETKKDGAIQFFDLLRK